MAKKRGPGRPPKNKKSAKADKSQHSVPYGFWHYVGALLIGLVGILLWIGLVGHGGVALTSFAGGVRFLIGFAAWIVPAILLWQMIQTFRKEDSVKSGVVVFATILFVICLAGLCQLLLKDPTAQADSLNGDGGGIVGWILVGEFLIKYFTSPISATILVALSLILLLFVLKISPKKLYDMIVTFFRQEDDPNAENNAKVAKDLAKNAKSANVAETSEFKVNAGVPIAAEQNLKSGRDRANDANKNPEPEKTALTIASDPNWKFPSLELLEKKEKPADPGDIQQNQEIIRDTLSEFSINVEMKSANVGPKVTQYTLKPPSGVKLSRITALDSSLALNLAAKTLRIEAPIPGEKLVGIEVPNAKAADVRLYGILNSNEWKKNLDSLTFAIGKDISGRPIISELNKMPHLVIAGQTGSGKSVMINSLLCSLLYRNSPADMKLILVDPKQVEMTPYNDIPHLLTPVITDPEKTISALKWAVGEMERRYDLLSEERVRDIKSYNQKTRGSSESGETMPYIVIVVDEMADLMMMAKRDVEALVVRVAQKARAVGIHLVLATQRPSVDVITGLIKANVPARIAFTVASQVDSRTILDQVGAEKLLGQGDMLLSLPSMSKPKRIQGAFLSEEEVLKITDYLRMERPPEYNADIIAQQVSFGAGGGVVMDMDGSGDSEYKDAVKVVVEARKASTSLLQRRLRIGYSKAARIMEQMEENGIIGPQDGSRPREVLVSSIDEAGE